LLEFDYYNNGSTFYGNLFKASNGKLYGKTRFGLYNSRGGFSLEGVMFELDPNGDVFTVLREFDNIDGGGGYSYFAEANGKLYGFTESGGTNGWGTFFEMDLADNSFRTVANLSDAATGGYGQSALTLASNNKIYAKTSFGGGFGRGMILEYDVANDTLIGKISISDSTGRNSEGSGFLEMDNGRMLFTLAIDSTNGLGGIYEYNYNTNQVRTLYRFSFANNGLFYPYSTLTKTSEGRIFGVTSGSGGNILGGIFEWDDQNKTIMASTSFDSLNFNSYMNSLVEVCMTNNDIAVSGGTLNAVLDNATYRWYNCNSNQFIAGATDRFFTPVQSGNYSVEVNAEGCSIMSPCINITISSVNQVENSTIRIFPNPASSILNVVLDEVAIVEIFSINGVKIMEYNNQQQYEINISNLPAGMYLLRSGPTVTNFIKN
jgi:hypothetical protein